MNVEMAQYCCGMIWLSELSSIPELRTYKYDDSMISRWNIPHVDRWATFEEEFWDVVTAKWHGMFIPTVLCVVPVPEPYDASTHWAKTYEFLTKFGFTELSKRGRASVHSGDETLRLMMFDLEPYRATWQETEKYWKGKRKIATDAYNAEYLRRQAIQAEIIKKLQEAEQAKEGVYARAMQKLRLYS